MPKGKWAEKINNPSTEHCFYSAIGGKNRAVRVSRENPPVVSVGLVVDYDGYKATVEEALGMAEKRWNDRYKPGLLSSTFSGYTRAVWLFERPVLFTGWDHYERFIKKLDKYLKFQSMLPGFDPKSLDPSLYYEAGTNWTDVEGADFVPETLVGSVASETMWPDKDFGDGVEIPFEEIEKEMERRGWRDRWAGSVEENVRGCRFWDEATYQEGTSNSVVLFKGGVFDHSSRVCQGFQPWSEIFGKNFTDGYLQETFGDVIPNFYYAAARDRYYYRHPEGWVETTASKALSVLHHDYGINAKKDKEGNSPADTILHRIFKERSVVGAVSMPNKKEEILDLPAGRYLNTGKPTCLQPATVGDVDKWPFICALLEGLFKEDIQIETMLAWLKRFYQSHLNLEPLWGQAVIMAGNHGGGKSLFMNGVVGGLVGAGERAKEFLRGESRFSAELIASPLWVMDDEDGEGSYRARAAISAKVKDVVASGKAPFRQKFGVEVSVPWAGRVMIACNLDDDSLRAVLPNIEHAAVRDKLLAFRTYSGMSFPTEADQGWIMKTLEQELPHFAKFLLDHDPDPATMGQNRFGVQTFIHPELDSHSQDISPKAALAEVLARWADVLRNEGEKEWTGTTTAMVEVLKLNGLADVLDKALTSVTLGRYLSGFNPDASLGFTLSKDKQKGLTYHTLKV